MRRVRVTVVDLITNRPTRNLHARVMNPNFAGIMPQVVAVWCEEAGHRVHYLCYTGLEDLPRELSRETDVLFIAAFTQAAHFAYALSTYARRRGAITVLGGPHARCYPDDSVKYFDYVMGFTDRDLLQEILRDAAPQPRVGLHLAAPRHPRYLPGVRERWKFIAPTLAKSLTRVRTVPMIGSLGCPYRCSFCIDAEVPYQPLDYEQLREDLRFLVRTMPGAWVGWHDPNFGVRFDDYLGVIEDAVPPGTLTFGAESSLSLLSERNVRRLAAAGFQVMLPGIESWFEFGDKAKTGRRQGEAKMRAVSEHVNMILRHIPYVQTNFILGLDCDAGAEPFELTKRFIERTPGAYPALSPLIAYGEVAPLNLEFQRDGRVLPIPFHFLNNRHTNLRLKHYGCEEFYERAFDLHRFAFSPRAVARRLAAQGPTVFAALNVLRALGSDGRGRVRHYERLLRLLRRDAGTRAFLEGETGALPPAYHRRLARDLGPLARFLPPGALEHDPNAYLRKHAARSPGASTLTAEVVP